MSGVRDAAVTLLAIWLLAGCGGAAAPGDAQGVEEDGRNGAVLTEPYVVPDISLADTNGAPYSLAGSTDKPLTLVFFGYTHCPDICQMVMANLASAMTRLDADQRSQVDVVLVTTDPARDDGATLRGYLDRFDPAFIGLTGDLDTIKGIGKRLGVFIAKGERLPSGGYEVDHGTPVVAVTSDDRAPLVWTQGTSAAEIAEDVAALLDEEAG